MNTIFGILLIVIAIGFLSYGLYLLRKNRQEKKRLANCQAIFEALFSNIDGAKISHQERYKLGEDRDELTYGEITFDGFSEILNVVQPKSGEVFYDLGSGTGKAVVCAALLYNWQKCCGIELLEGLHQESLHQLEKLQGMPGIKISPIEFSHGDFTTLNISDANIIFINATCYLESFWGKVVQKLNTVKPGARIIVTSKRLDESQYQLRNARMVPMSWGMNSIRVYQKI